MLSIRLLTYQHFQLCNIAKEMKDDFVAVEHILQALISRLSQPASIVRWIKEYKIIYVNLAFSKPCLTTSPRRVMIITNYRVLAERKQVEETYKKMFGETETPLQAYVLVCKKIHRHSKFAEDSKSSQGHRDMFWVEQSQTQNGCDSLYSCSLD